MLTWHLTLPNSNEARATFCLPSPSSTAAQRNCTWAYESMESEKCGRINILPLLQTTGNGLLSRPPGQRSLKESGSRAQNKATAMEAERCVRSLCFPRPQWAGKPGPSEVVPLSTTESDKRRLNFPSTTIEMVPPNRRNGSNHSEGVNIPESKEKSCSNEHPSSKGATIFKRNPADPCTFACLFLPLGGLAPRCS